MSNRRFLLGILGMVVLPALPSLTLARILRVERDGTGDFATIQPAIQAASAGDTVLIGPGRYTEYAPFSPQAGGWVEYTYVGVTRDNLTIRGTDRDAVIIGPATANFNGFGPKGIATRSNLTGLRVENLTIENVHDGIYFATDLVVQNCLIRLCDLGIFGGWGHPATVQQCEFRNDTTGIWVVDTEGVEVLDSHFAWVWPGVSFQNCQRANVRTCVFTTGGSGVQYDDSSSGTIDRCTFDGLTHGNSVIDIGYGSTVWLVDNQLRGGMNQLSLRVNCHVSGSGNLLLGATQASLLLQNDSTVDLSGNDILPANGIAIRTDNYWTTPFTLNLSGNYWGVETAAEIAARIHDGNDDPTVHAFVDFEPFSIRSVPRETMSVGDLKLRYRQQN